MTEQQIDSEGFAKPKPTSQLPPHRVTVTNVDISFGSMIEIIFKAVFASFVVALTFGAVAFVIGLIFVGAGRQLH